MNKEEKDMIEPIKNWDYTYRYDGSRTSGKSYYQELLDQKQQELERYKNIVDELEKYLKKEERINNGIIINLTAGNVARMDAGVKNEVLDKVLDKLKELKERNKIDE